MRTLAAIIALACVGCAEFAGNGVSASVQWTDPQSGATIDIHTAK